ncbi:MarR family winged helix-turn-helix transcriptional regulator [Oscillibacter sp.]|uniref:MarR family winged helix-turn-helix transcriptional regulator n=1 Tax=Oscillibacter sp. TaxID=1945593 RepID=UPI002D80B2DC|nr:MarR family transcriptional regulator [Oscillibacter sp.]
MLPDDKRLWEAWGQANALYTRWADARGINYYLLFVLYALDGQEAMTQKKICDCTGLTKQTVNSVIRALKDEGRVVLSPGREDRREKRVSLTEEGAAYSRELLAPLQELERAVLTLMGSERARQMIHGITLFNTVFEKEMEKQQK